MLMPFRQIRSPHVSPPSWFEREDLLCPLIWDLLHERRRSTPGVQGMPAARGSWQSDMLLGEEGLGLDSLARLRLSCRLSEFFHIHETGAEDHLLECVTLRDLHEAILFSLRQYAGALTFRSSGSLDRPRACTHRAADLLREAMTWAEIVGERGRIVSFVPAHHLYGFIWTVMLPSLTGLKVRRAREHGYYATLEGLMPGDLVVAVPALWRFIEESAHPLPGGVIGVSSSAPLSGPLARRLAERGLSRLIDVFGASEVGGLGWREDPDSPFQALAHVSACRRAGRREDRDEESANDRILLTLVDGRRRSLVPPDRLVWEDERHFRSQGRRNAAIVIGGHDVHPEKVRDLLLSHPEVAEAAVRPDRLSGRLKAFVVPMRAPCKPDELAGRLRHFLKARLPSFAVPHSIHFGTALPRNEMGKPADW